VKKRRDPTPAWLTAMAQYEGFPLALRVRPAADTAANRKRFPHLATVTHQLKHVKRNGLPKAKYNQSLAEFDHDMHAFVERDGDGLVVLVETFAGKRSYYAYTADEARLRSRISDLRELYPQHVLDITDREDAGWRFYKRYRKQFPW
jgi:hypothetical protein